MNPNEIVSAITGATVEDIDKNEKKYKNSHELTTKLMIAIGEESICDNDLFASIKTIISVSIQPFPQEIRLKLLMDVAMYSLTNKTDDLMKQIKLFKGENDGTGK